MTLENKIREIAMLTALFIAGTITPLTNNTNTNPKEDTSSIEGTLHYMSGSTYGQLENDIKENNPQLYMVDLPKGAMFLANYPKRNLLKEKHALISYVSFEKLDLKTKQEISAALGINISGLINDVRYK